MKWWKLQCSSSCDILIKDIKEGHNAWTLKQESLTMTGPQVTSWIKTILCIKSYMLSILKLTSAQGFEIVWECSSAIESLGHVPIFFPSNLPIEPRLNTLISLYTNWLEPQKDHTSHLSGEAVALSGRRTQPADFVHFKLHRTAECKTDLS